MVLNLRFYQDGSLFWSLEGGGVDSEGELLVNMVSLLVENLAPQGPWIFNPSGGSKFTINGEVPEELSIGARLIGTIATIKMCGPVDAIRVHALLRVMGELMLSEPDTELFEVHMTFIDPGRN